MKLEIVQPCSQGTRMEIVSHKKNTVIINTRNPLVYIIIFGGGRLFEVGCLKSTFRRWGGGVGRLFETGRLLNFSTFRVGAYSRWVFI